MGGVRAQDHNCCAWIGNGCLAAKKAFPNRNDPPQDWCGTVALGDPNMIRDNTSVACCSGM